MTDSLEMRRLDVSQVHLRDSTMLSGIAEPGLAGLGGTLLMPNLVPPAQVEAGTGRGTVFDPGFPLERRVEDFA
ncbi:MAG: hypothetical protein AAFQ81_09910 [Pseudomonadota bacterium]